MTGNTKIWRAPLAGLASVAMIATMGMAAATANALTDDGEPEVVLDANGGVFSKSSDADAKTLKVHEEDGDNDWTDELYNTTSSGSFANIPTRTDGYTFGGWYLSKDDGQAVNPKTDFTDNTTLYAHWIAGSITEENKVTLDLGTVVENAPTAIPGLIEVSGTTVSVIVPEGDEVAGWMVEGITDAAGDGKLFEGSWKTQNGYDAPVSSMTPGNTYVPATVDAVGVAYQTSTALDSASDYAIENAKKVNDTATTLASGAELKRDYALGSKITPVEVYKTDSGALKKASIESTPAGVTANSDGTYTLPTDSTTVIFKYKMDSLSASVYHKVEAITDGKSSFDAKKDQIQMVETDKKADASKFTAPTKDGDEFAGWGTNDNNGSNAYAAYDFGTVVTADDTLYAWYKNVKVTFDLNYDKAPAATVIDAELTGYVDAPADPVRDGYKFKGWNASRDGSSAAFDPASPLKQNSVTFYAQWKKVSDATNLDELKAQLNSYPFDMDNIDLTTPSLGDDDSATTLQKDVEKDFTKASWTAFKRALNDINLDSASYKALLVKPNSTATPSDQKKAGELLDALIEAESKLVQTTKVTADVYRVYNQNNGDHVYAFEDEAQTLGALGLQVESPNFSALPHDSAKVIPNVTVEVYRVYDKNSGEHLNVGYDEGESLVEAGWSWDNDAKPMFYVPVGASDVALYRVYNPNATDAGRHVYAPEGEASDLVARGYVYDNYGKPVYTFAAAK